LAPPGWSKGLGLFSRDAAGGFLNLHADPAVRPGCDCPRRYRLAYLETPFRPAARAQPRGPANHSLRAPRGGCTNGPPPLWRPGWLLCLLCAIVKTLSPRRGAAGKTWENRGWESTRGPFRPDVDPHSVRGQLARTPPIGPMVEGVAYVGAPPGFLDPAPTSPLRVERKRSRTRNRENGFARPPGPGIDRPPRTPGQGLVPLVSPD